MEDKFSEGFTNQDSNKQDVNNFEFVLFLILILLIMSNNNTFNSYFQLLDQNISAITNIINLFSATSQNLQGVFQTPQKQKFQEPKQKEKYKETEHEEKQEERQEQELDNDFRPEEEKL